MQQQELMILISVEICSLWVYDNCKFTSQCKREKAGRHSQRFKRRFLIHILLWLVACFPRTNVGAHHDEELRMDPLVELIWLSISPWNRVNTGMRNYSDWVLTLEHQAHGMRFAKRWDGYLTAGMTLTTSIRVEQRVETAGFEKQESICWVAKYAGMALRLRCGENSMPSPLSATQGGYSHWVVSSLCLRRAACGEADLSSCMWGHVSSLWGETSVQFTRKGACCFRHVMRANSTTSGEKSTALRTPKLKKSKSQLKFHQKIQILQLFNPSTNSHRLTPIKDRNIHHMTQRSR